MKISSLHLSVIIPLYNEENRLVNIAVIADFFKNHKLTFELILVNDGSTDKTLDFLTRIEKKYHLRIISYDKNQGKGYAVQRGMLAARGKYRLFMDVDLSTPLNEFNKFIPHLGIFDILIGSRKIANSQLVIRQSRVRENLGGCFTYLSRKILGVEIFDFTCGFKCFSKEAAERIFSLQTIKRWGFDSEVLFIAQKKGLKIKEIPIVWKNDTRTKVKFPQDIIKSMVELLSIRVNDIKGRYD